MHQIKKTIKALIRMHGQEEIELPVKQVAHDKSFYVPDIEIEKMCKRYPLYDRVGVELFKVEGKKVWLPYYLSKGFFTAKADSLKPIKVIPIFPAS